MGINEIISKPIFKKWWFWVVIVVIVLGVMGAVTEDNSGTTHVVDNSSTSYSKDNETFNEDFDSLCNRITNTYSSIGTVSCQDDTTWENNHKMNPDTFPYEYRDISVTGDYVAYEIKVIASPENMDYFKEEYTCNAIYVGDGSCIVGEVNDNILYSIILDEKNQDEIISLSDELKTIINE